MKSKKLIKFMMLLLTFITVFSVSSSALTWDGSSAGGSTNAVNGSSKGYVIRSTYDSACVVGYRFSVVNQSGGMKVNKVIDVYRNTVNGDNAYNSSAKFTNKYNKKQLIQHKNDVMSTTYNKVNCYKESAMDFLTALPNPDGVKSWQAYENNINKVLRKIGVGSTVNMVFGDKVIIEPLFDVCLAGEYQALTVSEIAWCGRSVLGPDSNGGYSNGTSSTWGFIANYTNRIWPNKLYTPDGQGLWPAASAISYRNTFENLLTRGYGAGIAYQEKNNKELTICYDAYGSNVKMTDSSKGYWLSSYNRICSSESSKTIAGTANVYYHTLRYNNQIGGSGLRDFSSFGISAPTGYKFSYWKNGEKYFYENVTTYRPTDFTNDINNGSTYIWLTAKFSPITYYVKYNGNGATEGTTKNSWHTYDISRNLTPNAYYRDGYIFTGWNTKADGTGTNYANQQSVKNLTAKDGATINLYAQWKPTGYTIKFNGNGNTGGSTEPMNMRFNDIRLIRKNGFTRTGYKFIEWNKQKDGLGKGYYETDYICNLASRDGEVVTLYAHWKPINYSIIFNGNGSTQGTTPGMGVSYNETRTLTPNGFIRPGYKFISWNTKPDGSGTSFVDRQSIRNLTTADGKCIYLYAQWKPSQLLSLEPIAPNASYRRGTEVITSFNIVNKGDENCIPSDNIKAVFYVYDGGSLIKTATLNNVIVPAQEKNLIYFKWRVPVDAADISITGKIIKGGDALHTVNRNYSLCNYDLSDTPDTRYEMNAPDGFRKPETPSDKVGSATWTEWSYSGGKFKKVNKGIGFSFSRPEIKPDAKANSSFSNNVWITKSGYGIELSFDSEVKSLNGYIMPAADAYTMPQYAAAAFPEFSYNNQNGSFRTLEKISGQWVFRENADYGRVHFTPLWYPDGDYIISVTESDMWTPAGMIYCSRCSDKIIIKGSAYDDWFIQ